MHTTALFFTCVAVAAGLPQFPPQHTVTDLLTTPRPPYIPVISRNEVRDDSGQVISSYQSADGTSFEQVDVLKPTHNPKKPKVIVQQGSYSYISPDGTPVQVSYIADEKGFRPVGTHILSEVPVVPDLPVVETEPEPPVPVVRARIRVPAQDHAQFPAPPPEPAQAPLSFSFPAPPPPAPAPAPFPFPAAAPASPFPASPAPAPVSGVPNNPVNPYIPFPSVPGVPYNQYAQTPGVPYNQYAQTPGVQNSSPYSQSPSSVPEDVANSFPYTYSASSVPETQGGAIIQSPSFPSGYIRQ